MKNKFYCIYNNNGDLLAHDLNKEQALIMLAIISQEEPNAEWEIIEQEI